MRKSILVSLLLLVTVVSGRSLLADKPKLIGHWPLAKNANAQGDAAFVSKSNSVTFEVEGPTPGSTAAKFDGHQSVIEVAPHQSLRLGKKPFTISLWVNADEADDTPGDLVSLYDPKTRTGFQLGIYNHWGVTNSQSNTRQLHFGIDQGKIEESFADHGQLGNAVYVFSLCSHDNKLYASTCHGGEGESGRVFRYEGGDQWTDLGSPDAANAVSAMATFNGSLYVATSKYRLAGSALSESANTTFGGRIYRLDGDKWVFCGSLSPETEGVSSLIVFQGKLHAASLYRPAGFFEYEGGESWKPLPLPEGSKRVEATTVFNDRLYATCYDEASIFRFDGSKWETVGKLPDSTQTYGFAIYRGSLYVSEWPKGRVFRYDGSTDWKDVGRLGEELESMPLLVYNGKMYGGTLPLAGVFRFDEGDAWKLVGRVDETPDVKYRRAWSMAVYQGRLFVGALPSGRVKSIEAGRNVTWDQPFPSGWHHVKAVRVADRLRLFVDEKQVAESASFGGTAFDLTTNQPLQIGFGAQDYFRGRMADLRIEVGE